MTDEANEGDVETAADAPISLPANLNLKAATALLDTFRAHPGDAPLAVDASQVEQMSASGAMLFVSALRSREGQSPALTVHNATPPFVDAFSELGMFSEVMKMEFRQ